MFINRNIELRALNERYKSKKAEFVVIYGRRRTGKTELIKKFFKNKKHFYFLGDLQREEQLLSMFSEVVANVTKKEYMRFGNWDDLFKFLKDFSKERVIVVFDEVGYINRANKAFYSILQRFWDEYLQYTKIFLILCGSSISMMERGVLGYKSPLYGRRTGQMELNPLSYKDSRLFFPKSDEKNRVEFYSVTGGIPAYLKEFDENYSVFENIQKKILNLDSHLYKEPRFILLEELRDPTTYFSILIAISQSARKFNEISQKSYVEPNKLSKYLSVLLNLRLIERILPITERKELRRNAIYRIKDNLFNFWFRYIYPHESLIEGGSVEIVINNIKKDFNSFVSFTFEDICKGLLMELNKQGKLPFRFTKIGSWWHKDQEIDIVALNEETKEILFCECKWQEKRTGINTLEGLQEKSKLVEWNDNKRKEHFALFSKSGFNDNLHRKDVLLFDLKDIDKNLQ